MMTMISLLLKSYYDVLISIILASLSIFTLGLYFILRKPKQKQTMLDNAHFDEDFNAISGDDVLSTQLDLARAYIETGSKNLANEILRYVAEQGSAEQQKEARMLLDTI